MRGLDRRLRQLEERAGVNELGLSVILRTGVPRAEHDSEFARPICASIVSGPNRGTWMVREEGETATAFMSRVEKTGAGL